ncbi:MAG: hypothetical protein D6707_02230 [Bacteroidetes bacterium]|nr:MAG: hypothetical protein D6707_02230 [Bacteroidota bacterium]
MAVNKIFKMEKSTVIIYLISFLLFTSCQEPQSGPCDYEIYNDVLYTIKDISPLEIKDGKQIYKVSLSVNKSSFYNKELTLNEIKPELVIDSAFLVKNKLRKGLSFYGQISEIKDGTCTPYIFAVEKAFKE